MNTRNQQSWFKHLSAEEAIDYVEASPFGKDWEGNYLELSPLSWNSTTGILKFSDGRYQSTVRFQDNGAIRYMGDTNPLTMVELAIAEHQRKNQEQSKAMYN